MIAKAIAETEVALKKAEVKYKEADNARKGAPKDNKEDIERADKALADAKIKMDEIGPRLEKLTKLRNAGFKDFKEIDDLKPAPAPRKMVPKGKVK
jgi:hypothetical protein